MTSILKGWHRLLGPLGGEQTVGGESGSKAIFRRALQLYIGEMMRMMRLRMMMLMLWTKMLAVEILTHSFWKYFEGRANISLV